MATGQSIWYADGITGGIARVDIRNGLQQWTVESAPGQAFPALSCLGVDYRFHRVGEVLGSYQTGPDELVLGVGAGYWDGTPSEYTFRDVRLNMATGAVVQYPAPFGGSVYTEGWRTYQFSTDGSRWSIRNAVTGQVIADHAWSDPVFAKPDGGMVGLPTRGDPLGIIAGRLYINTIIVSLASFQVFDLDNLVTDGVIHGVADPSWPGGWGRLWTMTADPQTWLASRPGGEIGRDLLQAVVTTAHQISWFITADHLLAVMNAESGLRTDAYHPAGRYGLLQLTADQLRAAGWMGTPDEYLSAGDGQLPAIAAYLASRAVPPPVDEVDLWLCLHLTPQERADIDSSNPGTVIAMQTGGLRPDLYASHGAADVTGDGRLTVSDLRLFFKNMPQDPRLSELSRRTQQLAAIVPDWKNLAEVNQGASSASQLGLITTIVKSHQLGFTDGQVIELDPPAGTLRCLVDPVEVLVQGVR
jgi:hypothetical protein